MVLSALPWTGYIILGESVLNWVLICPIQGNVELLSSLTMVCPKQGLLRPCLMSYSG